MKRIYTIGRDESCDIVIPDQTDVVSRMHATLRVESKDKFFLSDQSRNGTYVNGIRMSTNVEIPVSRNDVVSFAHIYNLDWSLIPKPDYSWVKKTLVGVLLVVCMAGLVYAVWDHINRPNQEVILPSSVEPQPTDSVSNLPEHKEEPVKKDTVVIRDTVEVDHKETPKEKKEKKDSVAVEKPHEEIYNPIY